jgi:hypothetical protein
MDLTLEAFTTEEDPMGWIKEWRDRHERHTAHYWARTHNQWPKGTECACTGCLDAAEATSVAWWSE